MSDTLAQLYEALERIRHLEEELWWTHVNRKLPDKRGFYIVCIMKSNGRKKIVKAKFDGENLKPIDSGIEPDRITHWRRTCTMPDDSFFFKDYKKANKRTETRLSGKTLELPKKTHSP